MADEFAALPPALQRRALEWTRAQLRQQPIVLDPRVAQFQVECKQRLESIVNLGGLLMVMVAISIVGIFWGSLTTRGVFDFASLATGALYLYSGLVFYTVLHKSIGCMSRTIVFRSGFVVIAFIMTALFASMQTYTIASPCTQTPIPPDVEQICTAGWGLLLASVIAGWLFVVFLLAAAVLEYRLKGRVSDFAKYIFDVYGYAGADGDENLLVAGRWEAMSARITPKPPPPTTSATAKTIGSLDDIDIGKAKRKNV